MHAVDMDDGCIRASRPLFRPCLQQYFQLCQITIRNAALTVRSRNTLLAFNVQYKELQLCVLGSPRDNRWLAVACGLSVQGTPTRGRTQPVFSEEL